MTGTIELGDQYELKEDGTGDLIIRDTNNGTDVIKHDNSTGELTINEGILALTVLNSFTDAAGVSHSGELADASDVVDDHGNLSGLSDDDHTQYLLVDGTRAMSGALDMGSNNISNASDVDSTSYSVGGDTLAQSVVFSGQTTLSSGEATIDTGISATDATFNLALGVDDPDADVDLTGRLFWDDSAGTYKIDIVEATTSVGNPTANVDVIRVR